MCAYICGMLTANPILKKMKVDNPETLNPITCLEQGKVMNNIDYNLKVK